MSNSKIIYMDSDQKRDEEVVGCPSYVEILSCKCYYGQKIYDGNFSKHLCACKTYTKISKLYQKYLNKYSDKQNPDHSPKKIQENAEKLKIIVEFQLGIIQIIESPKELVDLIDIKTFPQSFFKYSIDDIKALSQLNLLFLRNELECLLDNVQEEYKESPNNRKRISSVDYIEDPPQTVLSRSASVRSIRLKKKHSSILKPILLKKCDNCKKSYSNFPQIYKLDRCEHSICSICLANVPKNYVQQLGKVLCLMCNVELTKLDLNDIIGISKLKKLDEVINKKKSFPLIECVKCKEKFHKDTKLWNSNRPTWIKCSYCNTDQCLSCRCFPYHDNVSCKEYNSHTEIKICRYCNKSFPLNLNINQKPALQDICPFDECPEKSKIACLEFAPCGHPCKGVRDETECLGCINEDCQKRKENPINGNDLCMICYSENLSEAPCVKSKCGHVYHYQCVLKMLNFKWNTKWISFNFCSCPLCKDLLKFEGAPEELTQKIQEAHNLYNEVRKKASEKFKCEERDENPKLKNKDSYFFNKPEEYAMKLYAYYECFKCKRPYFGGHHNCEHELQNDNEEHIQEIKREDYICFSCYNIGKNGQICMNHNEDFLLWKCKFCCSIAKRFCHGNTHYCLSCHDNWQEQQIKAKVGKLVQCTKETCKLKIDHPPHGQEFFIGCGACQ